jgi:hypothetical protein
VLAQGRCRGQGGRHQSMEAAQEGEPPPSPPLSCGVTGVGCVGRAGIKRQWGRLIIRVGLGWRNSLISSGFGVGSTPLVDLDSLYEQAWMDILVLSQEVKRLSTRGFIATKNHPST